MNITEKFLYPDFVGALEFREGFLFFRVVRRRICQYKPWRLVDAAGNDVDIPPSSAQAELRFRDPRNPENDILYLDTALDSGLPWFLHGSIGVRPSCINVYLRVPEGQAIQGKFPNIDPVASGDSTGYFSWYESPYESPTDFVELVIPPGVHVGAEYYNTDPSRAHQPVLNLLFAVYWVQFLNPSRHGRLISSIATRSVPASFLAAGGNHYPLELGELGERWGVQPLSLDQASALGGAVGGR